MGQSATADGVIVRGGNNPAFLMTVNSDGSINTSPASGATWTIALGAVTLGTNGVVSVNNAETTVLAANASRKGAMVQNHGSSTLQLHFTAGQAYGSGPIQLAAGQSWNADQNGGVYRGIVYGIRAAATENAGVVEEV